MVRESIVSEAEEALFQECTATSSETGNGDAGARETHAEKPRGALRAREAFEAKKRSPSASPCLASVPSATAQTPRFAPQPVAQADVDC